jgi:hypothetical protein
MFIPSPNNDDLTNLTITLLSIALVTWLLYRFTRQSRVKEPFVDTIDKLQSKVPSQVLDTTQLTAMSGSLSDMASSIRVISEYFTEIKRREEENKRKAEERERERQKEKEDAANNLS